ncbi:MAG: hypothetical protein JO218_08050 [Burkholderiales bacterium]|nr:hypothetical protein [Burkholderiales bacterium]
MRKEYLALMPATRTSTTVGPALTKLCGRFGRVTTVEVETGDDHTLRCYVELDDEAGKLALMREIGGFSFEAGVILLVPAST